MKKPILIILALVIVSCSQSKQGNEEKQKNTESTQLNSFTPDSTFNGDYSNFDSLHFSIIRRDHFNGQPFIESISNNCTKIDSWKEYYVNGQLKAKGLMTSSNHIYIGEWEYYSENGEHDSTVNYDSKQNISYFKALKIAETVGYIMPDILISKTELENHQYWEIDKPSNKESQEGQVTYETILIDCETGLVNKPNYIKTVIF